MRSIYSLVLILALASVVPFNGLAQQKQTDQNARQKSFQDLPSRENQFKEYNAPDLPSLNSLIQTALINSPLVKQQEAMVSMREWQKKSADLDWTKYLQLFSEARFGSFDYIYFTGTGGTQAEIPSTMRYNIGTRIQLNLFDALDQKKKTRAAESILDFEKAKVEESKRMVIDEVIKQYNQVITYREIVAIKSDNLQGQMANMEKMEQKFASGDEDLMEFARIKEIATKAQEEFELAKKEFRVAYMLLENLVGVKLSEI
jgi:outer membrane protein TolC